MLRCDALEMSAVNAGGRKILALVDGGRTVGDIAGSAGLAIEDVRAALLEMERQGIVRRVVDLKKERPENMGEAKYLADPGVSFRPEDGDGAILYHADTDSLEVVNPVAAEIWTYLAAPRTQAEVVAHLCATCEGAVRDQVEKDVAEFVESLLEKGFIGVVEDPA
ncbi:MAG: PqqD family peptide modification chaperone [Kiritimatiellia bacterium]